jgi:hypothetical protein
MISAVWLFGVSSASLTRVAASTWWATLWVVHRGAQGAERPEWWQYAGRRWLFGRASARPPLERLGACVLRVLVRRSV